MTVTRRLRLSDSWTEIRRAMRTLRRTPAHAIAIAGVLALCVALAATVLAIVDGVLFKPLDVPNADRLVIVEPLFRGLSAPASPHGVSAVDLEHWAAAAPDVGITGSRAQPWSGYGTGVNDSAAGVAVVLPNFFDVIGVRPRLGGFAPADFEVADPFQPVILTDDVWRERFGGDPGVIGRRVTIDPMRPSGYRIAGIMPPGFRFPTARTDVKFIGPLVTPLDRRNDPQRRDIVEVIARLPDGVSASELQTRVEAGMAALARTLPPQGPRPEGWSEAGWRRQGPFDAAAVQPLSSYVGRESRPLFAAVFAAVLLIVVLAAVNVSGLMAARVVDRSREFAVRRALGAGAGAIARLVWFDVFALVVIGAGVGLAVAPLLLRFAVTLLPDELVLLRPAAIDARIAGLIAAATIAIAVPVSIWPIRRAVSAPALDAGATRTSERTNTVGRRLAIAVQIAGAFALAVGGAMFVASMLRVYAIDVPVRTERVGLVEIFLRGPGATMGTTSPERVVRVDALLDRVRQVPGVEIAAATSAQVLRGGNWVNWFTAPKDAPNRRLEVDRQSVTRDYYRLLEPQLVAGRLPTDDELATNAPVIVVSETVARAYWADGQAVGRVLDEQKGQGPYRVVGVVRDVPWYSWDTATGSIYAPYARTSREPMVTLMLRTHPGAGTGEVLDRVMAAMREHDATLSASRAMPLDDLFVDSVRARRLRAWLFGSFAAGALAVVGIGIFGLLAMATSRRTKELGIRQALGSTRVGVLALFVREQLVPVGAGVIAGGLLAIWASRFIESFLFVVTPADIDIWLVAALVTLAVAALGVLVPAARASRTDPVVALRQD